MGKLKLFQVYQGRLPFKRKSQFLTGHFLGFTFCILGPFKSGHTLIFRTLKIIFKNNFHMLGCSEFY